MKFNLDGGAGIKAWFYDKAANRETILVEQIVEDSEQALEILNHQLEVWFARDFYLIAEFERLKSE